MDINLVIIQGRIVRELEYKLSGVHNRHYCNNSIAVDRGKDEKGNKKEALFINFTVWEKNAEYLYKYAKKGGRIIIEGRLEQKKNFNYEKNINEYELFVVPKNIQIIDWKEKELKSNLTGELPNQNINSNFEKSGTIYQDEIEISEDELPF